LFAEPIPGFDRIAVVVRQVFQPIQDERGGDALAGTARCIAGLVEDSGDFDDLFDFPLPGMASLEVSSICPFPPASRAGLSRLRSTSRSEAWP